MTSPQITALKQQMYAFNNFHSRNTLAGLQISSEDQPEFEKSTFELLGFEARPVHYSAIKGNHSRWWEVYWGRHPNEYVYDMMKHDNGPDNSPMPSYSTFGIDTLDNNTISGMPQLGPWQYDDHVSKILVDSQKQRVRLNDELHTTVPSDDHDDQIVGTDTRFAESRINIDYTVYQRHILQALFHICIQRQNWKLAFDIFGSLNQNKNTNALFSMPWGLEVLRGCNFDDFKKRITSIAHKPILMNKFDNVKRKKTRFLSSSARTIKTSTKYPSDLLYVPTNTLHALAELKNPSLLPLMIPHTNHFNSDADYNNFQLIPSTQPSEEVISLAIKELTEWAASPTKFTTKMITYLRHLSKSEKTTEIFHLNGPETALLHNFYNDDFFYTEFMTDEQLKLFDQLNKLGLNEEAEDEYAYTLQLPTTKQRKPVLAGDRHSHYRLGNSKKFSPATMTYINVLLHMGDDSVPDTVTMSGRRKDNTAEGDYIKVQSDIMEILAKLGYTISQNNNSHHGNILNWGNIGYMNGKDLTEMYRDVCSQWQKWKKDWGYQSDYYLKHIAPIRNEEHEERDDDYDDDNSDKELNAATKWRQYRLEGMTNWQHLDSSIENLGSLIEYVQKGGLIGLGSEAAIDMDVSVNDIKDKHEDTDESGDTADNDALYDLLDGVNDLDDGANDDYDEDADGDETDSSRSNSRKRKASDDDLNESDDDNNLIRSATSKSGENQLPDSDMDFDLEEFDENDPTYQMEMAKLMNYDSQTQNQSPASTDEGDLDQQDSVQVPVEGENDDFDAFDFNSDDSEYEREMAKYSQYSQQPESPVLRDDEEMLVSDDDHQSVNSGSSE